MLVLVSNAESNRNFLFLLRLENVHIQDSDVVKSHQLVTFSWFLVFLVRPG